MGLRRRPTGDQKEIGPSPILTRHSRYRVNGVVANMPEFAEAFACHKGQAMARENRCRVW